jgi:WD40 repeat protein
MLYVYNQNFTLVSSIEAHSAEIFQTKILPNGFVATSSNSPYNDFFFWEKTPAEVKIWDPLNSWTLIRSFTNHSDAVWALDYIDEDTMVSGDNFGVINIWLISTGQTKRTINPNGRAVYSVKMLGDGINLAVGLSSGDISIFDINTGSLVATLNGQDVNNMVQISEDLLASASYDGSVRIWNLTTNTCKFILSGHIYPAYGLKKINSQILASGSADSTIKLWDITTGQEIRTLTGHTSYIHWSLDLLNSQTLISGSYDGTVRVWDWSTGDCLRTINTPTSYQIYSLAVWKPVTCKKFH